jgi:hypothetical protein
VVSTNWNQNDGQTNHKQLTHMTQHNPNLGGVHNYFQIYYILCDSWWELHQNGKNSQDSKIGV